MAKKRADGLRQKQVTIGGKRHVFYGHSEREIMQKIREYKEDAKRGRTFQAVADEWKEEHFPTLSPTTAHGYIPALNRAIKAFGPERVSCITPKAIQKYLDRLAKAGFSHKTVSNHLVVINLIFNKAVLYGDIEYNPCAAVRVPKGLQKGRRDIPTAEEIEVVKSSLSAPFGLFAFLLLYTGCRRGEALALTYGDIDRENRLIHVTKSVYHDSNIPKIKRPKTAAGTRKIVLLDVLYNAIPIGPKDQPVFAGPDGGYMTNSYCRHMWERYLKATGLSITPHQLRHAYATILYEAGISDKDAQQLLGHANISTTRDIYTHISKSHQQLVADTLNAAIVSKKSVI